MYSGETAMSIVFRNTVIAAAATLALASLVPTAGAAESEELRAEVAALKKRLEQVESSAKAQSVPAWVNKITWKGDLRFRNESIDQQYAPDRNRFRIRARAGLEAKVNDTIRAEFALATTEGSDPRASNQTLTGENSRKPILLDIAYAEWAVAKDWKLAAGKMRFPLIRPGQTSFIDADVNPEGLAATWTHGDFFAAGLYNLPRPPKAHWSRASSPGARRWGPASCRWVLATTRSMASRGAAPSTTMPPTATPPPAWWGSAWTPRPAW
jgi:hypothetical protein